MDNKTNNDKITMNSKPVVGEKPEPQTLKKTNTNTSTGGNKQNHRSPAGKTGNQQAKPAVNQQAKPAVNQQAKPAGNQQTKPAGNQQTKPAVNQQAKPAVNQQTKPAVNQQTKPAVNQQAKPAVNKQAKPVVNQQAKPAVNRQAKPQQQNRKPSGNTPKPQTRKTPPRNTASTSTTGNTATGAAAPKKTIPRKKALSLRVIPLGGLCEVGKNITYYEYDNEAILIDCGMAFPDHSMPGIDIVIPDFTYVIENQKKIKALYITHGHEDHIGSIPYLLKHFNVPIYATKLTIGLIEGKLKEHGLLRDAKLHTVVPGDTFKTGHFTAEFINVNHSFPDACAIAVHTPMGIIIQTGDFKVDYTPIGGNVINLARFGELGSQGVLALLSDSTNAERPGSTSSERIVGASLEKLFLESSDKRIIVATFASNVHRIQQIIDAAIKTGRKVAVSGRSMENVTSKAVELGYLTMPKDVIIEVDEAGRYPDDKVVLITTGSQGEPMSALSRMARGDHRQFSVTKNDCIIISATPIPGNELFVTNVVNDLLRLGAKVVYDNMYDIHVSGHACQDELKLMMLLTKPKYFLPVHGEFKHLIRHAELAKSMGIPENNIHVAENGQVQEFTKQGLKHSEMVTAGKILVDGLGVGDVGNIVLRDRMHLSEDGLIVVIAAIKRSTGEILSGPDIVSRGFVYVRESEDMLSKACAIAKKSISSSVKDGKRDWGTLKTRVRDDMGSFIWQLTKRRPMILPVIQEID